MKEALWTPRAERDLLDMPWQDAERVVNAITLFALAGEGSVVRLPNPLGADEHRLYVPPEHRYYALIRAADTVVYVERVLVSP